MALNYARVRLAVAQRERLGERLRDKFGASTGSAGKFDRNFREHLRTRLGFREIRSVRSIEREYLTPRCGERLIERVGEEKEEEEGRADKVARNFGELRELRSVEDSRRRNCRERAAAIREMTDIFLA